MLKVVLLGRFCPRLRYSQREAIPYQGVETKTKTDRKRKKPILSLSRAVSVSAGENWSWGMLGGSVIVYVAMFRIRIGSGFNWVSGSGTRQAKIGPKKEKMKKFHV